MPDGAPRLARSAGLFGLATMASRILGLVREQVLAFYFGADDALDAFRVAFRIPNLVRDLFAEGAMSAAFVPTFTHELTSGGKPRAWALANTVVTALILITGMLAAIAVLFAEPLVRLLADDYSTVPGKLELTIYLARIMAPFLTMVALAAVAMGMLNSLGHFFMPALSPAMFNIAGIVIAVLFIPVAPSLGIQPIVLIAIATLIGGVGQVLLQLGPLQGEGYAYRPSFAFNDPAVHRVLLLMGPGTIGMAATQINVLVNTQFASSQGTGAVSWLDYAFRLMYLPIGLFGVSIAAASTPALSRLAALSDMSTMRTTVGAAIGLMLVLNIPATVGLIVLAVPIVSLIFEHGRFTPADTAATARALQLYALGLVAYSVVRIVSPAFYALRLARIPVTASIASVAVNIAVNVALVRVMGYAGLALGTSIAAMVNAALQVFLLRRHLGGIEGRQLTMTFLKILAAGLAMGAAVGYAQAGLDRTIPGRSIPLQALRVTGAITIGLGVLAAAASLLRVREFHEARDLVRGRLRKLRR